MDAWRGVMVLCALLVGCGGATDSGGQGDERPPDSQPSENPDNGPPADQDGDPSDEEPGDGQREPPPVDPPPTEPPPTEPPPTEPPPTERPQLGTAVRVTDLLPPSTMPPRMSPVPENLVGFKGRLYFSIAVGEENDGLWTSDGSTAGTVRVKDRPVAELTPVGSRLFFVGSDAAQGTELWVSDGTTGGTRSVADLTPGPEDTSLHRLTPLGQTLLFFRNVTDTSDSGHTELWRSDGSASGTSLVKHLGPESSLSNFQARVGDTLFFVLSDAAHGTELWKTDGTAAGTTLVRDLIPGEGHAYPSDLQAVGNTLFFLASTTSQGRQLWKTDGTPAGTVFVRDIAENWDGPHADLVGVVGQKLFFALSDPADQRMRLYTLTVDAAGGTTETLITNLPNPYADQPSAQLYLTDVAVAENKVFLGVGISTPGPAPRDVQLWVTDGTEAGTLMLARPLSLSDEFTSQLYALDDRILFSAIGQGTGLEPWVSDGTVAGTRLLQDLETGAGGSFSSSYTRVGNQVFFVAFDSAHGNELWVLPLQP